MLYRKSRTVEFLWLGDAHTNGDVWVYLPKEKILICGDALAMLAECYEWFTEGFNTSDLQEAGSLLNQLS